MNPYFNLYLYLCLSLYAIAILYTDSHNQILVFNLIFFI